jgi:hypothetical protein
MKKELHLRIDDKVTYDEVNDLINGLSRMKNFDFIIDDSIQLINQHQDQIRYMTYTQDT